MAPASLCCISNTVCVMDASSRLGSSLVKRLLERGFTVHAAIQNHGNHELMSLPPCDKKGLKIFQSDPFDYHSVLDALKGCSCLFYSFEPPKDHSNAYDEYMAEVEVRAAHNVLEACAQTETIEKVVFTSSATAIIWGHDHKKSASFDLDERHWSDINFCRKFKLWHALAKTLAEKTAWALAMDRGLNMVSINSGLLISPDLNITNPYLNGVAEIYLCFNHIINTTEDAFKLAEKLFPLPSSPSSFEKDTRIIQQRISNKKLNKLMVDFRRSEKDLLENQED
ncbi:cinnamoyl-CoA reductase-like SNL6 isoform X2 [Nicotiana sylvestris]|uniref:Bifunctional dihydroflavonol 4-reductase/flavanone 4-reductase-like isoform X2 n=1 Tax=Nicotiana sylvestris TaxID=4096 RepID=A0A1U7XS09_NICSY|nr:PREDICTED: bifunctional dihydroflavonol 4-reductase/flavanone 4-reductase-like isoform X2 [Nicotiana sylvestris]